MFDALKNRALQTYISVAENVIPVLKESQFEQKGVITPEEFTKAGDQLVFKCPTWSWHSAEKGKWDHLPADKQFLITRQVPCAKRCKEVQEDLREEQVEATDDDDGWCQTFSISKEKESQDKKALEDIPSIDDFPNKSSDKKATLVEKNVPKKEEEIPSLDDFADFEEENLDEDDEEVLINAADIDQHIVRTRTYDISISYDIYYQCPHVWLRGYDEYSNPLTNEQILEDISSDHSLKTATFENHPFLKNLVCVSIHPCRHSEVMKTLCDRMRDSKKEIRVDQYLFLFLKFLSAIIPTVQYDYTMDVEM